MDYPFATNYLLRLFLSRASNTEEVFKITMMSIIKKFFRIKYIFPLAISIFCFAIISITTAKHIARLDVFYLSGDVSAVYLDVLHKKDDLLSYKLEGGFAGTFTSECAVYDNGGQPLAGTTFQLPGGSGFFFTAQQGYMLKVDGAELRFDGDGLFIVYRDHASGENFYSARFASLYPNAVYLTHIKSFLSDGNGRLLLLNEEIGQAVITDSRDTERFSFSLEPLEETSLYLLLVGGLFCFLIWFLAMQLLSEHIFAEVKSTCKNNKIISSLLVIWSFVVFAVFYPGMQTADNHFAVANSLSYIDSIGTFYMWFCTMVRAIGLHNGHLLMLALFFVTFYNFLYLMDKKSVKYIIKVIFLLFCIASPAVVFALMEEKRLATTAMLFYSSLSFFLRLVMLKSENPPSVKKLLPFILLYSATILCRPDYIIFAPFLFVIGIYKLHARLSLHGKIVFLALTVLIPVTLWQFVPPFPEDAAFNAYYKMIPKISMISPYVRCDEKDNPQLVETLDKLGGYEKYCELGPRKFRWEMHKQFWEMHKQFHTLSNNGEDALVLVRECDAKLTNYFKHNLWSNPLKYMKYTANNTLQMCYSLFHWNDKYTILEKRRGSAQTFIGARFFYDQDYGEVHKYFYKKVSLFYFKKLQTPLKFGFIALFCIFILYPAIFRRSPVTVLLNLSCLSYVFYLGAVSPEPGLAYMLPAALWVSYAPAIAALERFCAHNVSVVLPTSSQA
jgi:hypothetical protein